MELNFETLEVKQITRELCKPFILGIHYAKRLPIIQYAYGVYNKNDLLGIVSYGVSPNRNSNKLGEFKILELNRVCLKVKVKNLASFLISKSLKLLPKPLVLISYADGGWNHHGYIYQATNWYYTGISKGQVGYLINGKEYHKKAVSNKYGTVKIEELEKVVNSVKGIRLGDKFRYFQFIGSKVEKKKMLALLGEKYSILPYPKGDNVDY